MRPSVKEFVSIIAKVISCPEPLYEFGSFQVSGDGKFADLRGFFTGKKYIGADMRAGPGVDVVLDLHKIDLPDSTAGTVLMLDTLEHVENPILALSEVNRILKNNGVIIMSSVMNFPIHAYPSDYWRYTPEAFKSLLKPFPIKIVSSAGQKDFPHTVAAFAAKGDYSNQAITALENDLTGWEKKWSNPFRGNLKYKLKQLTPPAIIHYLHNKRTLSSPS